SGLAPCADGVKDVCGGGPTCSIFQVGCNATNASGGAASCSYSPWAVNSCPDPAPSTSTPAPYTPPADKVDDAIQIGFGCIPPAGAQRRVLSTAKSSEDHGIIMVRFYIHHIDAAFWNLLGDHRGPSDDPGAAYRMELFWDTATGEISFTVAPSTTRPWSFLGEHFDSKVLPARPLDVGPYSPKDTTLAWHNNLNPLELSADKIKMDIHGINASLDAFSANATVTVSLGTHSVSVERKGDRYPDMEVVQYRRGMAPNMIGRDPMKNLWWSPEDGLSTMPPWDGGRDAKVNCPGSC
ncbi:hypothetical protein ACIPLC_38160, partial [Kitasatospora sp. NPDC086801]|uniref:hypothetical protein n=1 Tax=Kitasatospora sp. NPDC086801 TaxID=3364066 RepID=UPI0038279811